MKVCSGKPYPLGTNCQGDGTNFALFSANAEKVELCLFNDDGNREIARIPLPCRTDDVWHGFVHNIGVGTKYGYRVYGPYDPLNGHRFNHHKLLIDPYTRQLHGTLVDSKENLGYVHGHEDGDLSFDTRDNSHNIPKSVVTVDDYDWSADQFPEHALDSSVMYEAHVKGLTQRFPDLDESSRGTYSAIGHQSVIEHLKTLGITTLELLPVHTFVDDSFLLEKSLRNYWGYNSLCFFAPAAIYGISDPVAEFRDMVKALHAANIELILDVVYNHTAEGNELGPTLCYRGIDNASYYRLEDDARYYSNHSGCGNTLKTSHPRVLQLVMDSLRFWTRDMHVDGFRFDLASTLARRRNGYDRSSGFFDAIMQDPALMRSKLIAEPWDCGLGGYQLGNFPPRFCEWNDQYRDTLRRFWAGEPGQLQQLSKAVHGSSEIFEWQKRGPHSSINLITTHDGYTLEDLVSYEQKHNDVNGEENRDGHSANYSRNYGHEGPTDDQEILQTRQQQRRNLMATLLLSQGVPLILAGDELANTQSGNNNAYCQDNEITWLDWSQRETEASHLSFVQKLLQLRKRFAVLRRREYMHGANKSPLHGLPDISWLNANAQVMQENEWQDETNRFMGVLLCGDAIAASDINFSSSCGASCGNESDQTKKDCKASERQIVQAVQTSQTSSAADTTAEQHESASKDASVLLLINGSTQSVDFPLPKLGKPWHLELTTADPDASNCILDEVFECKPGSVALCSLSC